MDLNSLHVFETVASLNSFSAAARSLGVPRSNVSRSIARIEKELGTRLFQRTTREVALTSTGVALKERCAEIMASLQAALDYVGSLSASPRGRLKIGSGIGFGINVLAEQLPDFLRRYPEVDVSLHLESRLADLVSDAIDVSIRLGPMRESGLVAIKLGEMTRHACAASQYLERRGAPRTLDELKHHDTIDMLGSDGRTKPWVFTRKSETYKVNLTPRVCVNEALTIHRLVMNGAGIGILSGYLCAPAIASGALVQLFPEWKLPTVDVSIVFPSRRELAPAIRAFTDFMKEVSAAGAFWQQDALADLSRSG